MLNPLIYPSSLDRSTKSAQSKGLAGFWLGERDGGFRSKGGRAIVPRFDSLAGVPTRSHSQTPKQG